MDLIIDFVLTEISVILEFAGPYFLRYQFFPFLVVPAHAF